jgi:tetraacyldisaccharide 4'-kinase
MRAPEFWLKDGPAARLLSPLGALYGLAGKLRRATVTPARLNIPVICVGNLTAGGTGKTPTALAIAALLAKAGKKPAFLTRGYGGRESGPLVVDPRRHDAESVGDEALLLTAAFPTIVAQDRPAGGALAVEQGADLLIMDDGFQNPALAKDFSLLVFDGGAGLGNGRLIPAGPLRESLAEGVARADLALIIGEDRTGLTRKLRLPVLTARLIPDPTDIASLKDKRLFAFAGIGRPQKFFDSLTQSGLDLRGTAEFPDHHRFNPAELGDLRVKARAAGADLVTTAKDLVRLAAADRAGIQVLRVTLTPDDPAAFADAFRRFAA